MGFIICSLRKKKDEIRLKKILSLQNLSNSFLLKIMQYTIEYPKTPNFFVPLRCILSSWCLNLD